MSIIVSVSIPEGIVIAADSRQSYTNARKNSRVGSDFASKIFQLTPKIGVASFGWAFLQPQGANTLMSIGALVEDFRATMNPDINVSEAANLLSSHFQQMYTHDIVNLKWHPAAEGQMALGFQVVGYSQNSTVGEVYFCSIPPGNSSLIRSTNNVGCNWNGQTDVVTRLVLGFDPRLENLPIVKHLLANPVPNQENIRSQINSLQYIINWATMTLQDAIDFAALMVDSTIKMQRFSDGIFMDPGDLPGCGGEIDVAVITHREGFGWIRKKKLNIEI